MDTTLNPGTTWKEYDITRGVARTHIEAIRQGKRDLCAYLGLPVTMEWSDETLDRLATKALEELEAINALGRVGN